MKVAILGCGPAGLLAAHAAVLGGHEPVIYSRKVKSQMFGAMYLHRHIPGIHISQEPELLITVMKVGTKQGYAENVYGNPFAPVSWDKFGEGLAVGWNLIEAYDKLWDLYETEIVPWEVRQYDLSYYFKRIRFDKIFSTVPAQAICNHPSKHEFRSQRIWVSHGEGTHLIDGVNDDHMMYYNGITPEDGGHPWYRFSQINRYQAWEYSKRPPAPYGGEPELSTGVKPLDTNCDCHPYIHRLGRFGKWEKGVLTHHAFEEAQNALQQL